MIEFLRRCMVCGKVIGCYRDGMYYNCENKGKIKICSEDCLIIKKFSIRESTTVCQKCRGEVKNGKKG